MSETFNQLVANQFEAALCTLHRCVVHCPDSMWQEPVANNPYSQSVFHTLFFTDLYLGENRDAVKDQKFHARHIDLFAGYEQLADRVPTDTYAKDFIREYLEHCRQKARSVFARESREDLNKPSGFPWLEMTRAEVHLYNIRHIQHHAAQLILRLRKDADVDMPWIKTGWIDA